MSTIADLLVKVRADTGGAERDIKSFGSKVGGGFKSALLPATAALGGLAVVGASAFHNLEDGARNAKQTEAVLRSTGDASNVTAKHVDDLAMSLRKKAGVDDDVVHAGENMLLTFTNVRNEVGKGNDIFDQSTKVMLDMSHALGQSTTTSALQLGKALNDPIRGMTALQRVGVSFTESQKKQVKAMVEAGNSMGAQKLILHELNKEFGGSATNIDPTTKALANMKLNAVDLATSVLQVLMPTFQTFIGILSAATSFMTEHQTVTKVLVGVIVGLSVAVIAVNAAMKVYAAGQLIVKAATAAWTAAQWLLNAALSANPIGIVIVALVLLGAALVVLWTKSETFRRIVTGAWEAIKSSALEVFNAVKGIITGAWDFIRSATTAVLDFLKEHWRAAVVALALIITGPLGALVALIATHWNQVKALATGAWDAVASTVTGAVDRIRTAVSTVFGALGGIVKGAVKAVSGGIGSLEAAFAPIIDTLNQIVGAAQSAIGAIESVVNAASKVKGTVGGALSHLVPHFAGGVRNFGGGLALVGEQGPELVNLPGGSDVHTNAETRGLIGNPSALGAGGGDGDLVLVVDGQVFGRIARRELTRTGKRNVGVSFN